MTKMKSKPCEPGAHNPAVNRMFCDDEEERLRNICSRCGHFIAFVDKIWIVDAEKEPAELHQ